MDYGDEYLAELDHIEVVEKAKDGYESDVPELRENRKIYHSRYFLSPRYFLMQKTDKLSQRCLILSICATIISFLLQLKMDV